MRAGSAGARAPGVPRIWSRLLDGDVRERATAVAREVGHRLDTVEKVERAAWTAVTQSGAENPVCWVPQTLASGWPGLAVLGAALHSCFPDQNWDRVGHAYLSRGVECLERQVPLPFGLWSGAAGLGFAAHQLSVGGTRYSAALRTLDEVVAVGASELADQLREQTGGLPSSVYDLISGLTGAATYLLCRPPSLALETVVGAIAALSVTDDGRPRWYSPAALTDESMRARFPSGSVNCGMAHGVPGALALLALAQLAGVRVPGLRAAVERSADWLVDHAVEDQWGISWPYAVPVSEERGAAATVRGCGEVARNAWCYGSPGVARALWLAGEAAQRPDYGRLAVEAIRAVFRRPAAARRIASPTLCHGYAGLLQVVSRFAQDTGYVDLVDSARTLAEALVDQFNPGARLGYRAVDPSDLPIDRPGMLDGAAGVALALLAASTDREPTWDRALLLS